MKRFVVAGLVVLGLGLATSARALMIAPPPVMLRVAAADRVVVGTVTDVSEKAEPADLFRGDTRQLKVATVKVQEAVLGKKTTTVKVGFFYFPPPAQPAPGVRRPFLRRRPGVALAKDQEAMLFLTRHPTKKDLFLIQAYFDVVNKAGNSGFAAERAEALRAAKLLAGAAKGLDSKDETTRLESAAMLITRYRTAPTPPGVTKTEPAPAAESKKILTVLAEADWSNTVPRRNYMLNPRTLFYRLGLTPQDGWTPPKDFGQVDVAARKWLKDNAGKYKLWRFARPDDKKGGLEPEPE